MELTFSKCTLKASFKRDNYACRICKGLNPRTNLDLQLNALKEVNCEKVFIVKASGAQRERPELKAALSYMRSGDVLVVWKLDRLARSLKQLIDTIELLEKQGIGLCSLAEAIDTTNSGGKLIFYIFGALAEFERSLIRDRTMAGLKAAHLLGRC